MKNLILICLLGSFLLNACSSKENDVKATADSSKIEATDPYEGLSVIKASGQDIGLTKGEAQAFYVNYMQLRGYLVESDAKNAQAAAEYMSEDLRGTKGALADQINANVNLVKGTQNLAEQRAAFEKLSENLYEVVKAIEVIDTPIYVQHCPMAFDNKGATWLSDKKDIYNPYFGDAMLRCGSNEAVIAAK
jgi:hypothetical protein